MSVPQQYNHLTQTRYGTLIYNRFDTYVGRSIEYYGEYAEREICVFDQTVLAGMVVLDIGAQIGAQTLFFARKVGPAGRVLAFEPRRLMFQTLCANIAINSITNVHCWNAAVGARDGEYAVPVYDHQSNTDMRAIRMGAGETGDRVPLVCIDSMRLNRCDFIRILQPGMEEDILQGGQATILKLRPVFYIACELEPQREESLKKTLDGMGYNMYWHEPELFNPDNFAGNDQNIFGNTTTRSLLCVDRRVSQEMVGFTPAHIARAA